MDGLGVLQSDEMSRQSKSDAVARARYLIGCTNALYSIPHSEYHEPRHFFGTAYQVFSAPTLLFTIAIAADTKRIGYLLFK